MELPRPLTPIESEIVNSFKTAAEKRANTVGIETDWSISSVAKEAGIELWDFPKEGVVIQAFWVSLLSAMQKVVPKSSHKYPDIRSFQEAYDGYFDDHPASQLNNLLETANWMTILFTLIPAKKNKGLVLAVVPKFVEGWYAKYVTGSGQTKATADRVKIFETEGNCQPSHRGYSKSKKKTPKPVKQPKAVRATTPSARKDNRRKTQKENKDAVIGRKRGVVSGGVGPSGAVRGVMTRSASGARLTPSQPSISRFFDSFASFVNTDDLADDAADLALTDEDESSSEDDDEAGSPDGGDNESEPVAAVVSGSGNSLPKVVTASCDAGLFMESWSDALPEDDPDYLAALNLFRSSSVNSAPSLSRMSSAQSINFPSLSRVSSDNTGVPPWCDAPGSVGKSVSIDFSASIVPNDIPIESVSQSLEFLPGITVPGLTECVAAERDVSSSSSSTSSSSSSSTARPLQAPSEVLSLLDPSGCCRRTPAARETAELSSGASECGASEFELTMSSQDSSGVECLQSGWDVRENASGYYVVADTTFSGFGNCEAKEDGTAYGEMDPSGCEQEGLDDDGVGLMLDEEAEDDECKMSPRALNAAIYEAFGDLTPMTPAGAPFTPAAFAGPCFTVPSFPAIQQSRN